MSRLLVVGAGPTSWPCRRHLFARVVSGLLLALSACWMPAAVGVPDGTWVGTITTRGA